VSENIDHDNFCDAVEKEFTRKYAGGGGINKRDLKV